MVPSSDYYAWPQGTGDVSGDHETRLGNWHHGRVATHGDYQKNHIRKKFPAILSQKWTNCGL